MKVLWVTPHLPDPVRGGGWGTEYEFLGIAAAHHDVTVLTGGLAPGQPAPRLDDLGVRYEGVKWTFHPFPGRVEHLRRLLFGGVPVEFWQKEDCARALAAAIRRAEAESSFDLVQVMLGEMASLVTVPTSPTALFLFDAYSRQIPRQLALAPSARYRFMWQAEGRNVGRWERRFYPRADSVACVSAVDAAALEASLGLRPAVVPIPVPDDFYAPPTVPRTSTTVALISMLDYTPNIDAVEWFSGDVWPRVAAQEPTSVLKVVGRSPVDRVVAAVRSAGGELHADVPDARPYYWDAAVAAVPLRQGSGMRNKVLHAMATGAPLVATSVAIEGIGLTDGTHLLVADTADDFADAIVRTLRDPEGAHARAKRASEFIEGFRRGAIAPTFEAWWRDTIDTARVRGGRASPSG